MTIQVQCPQCQSVLKVRDDMAGRKGKCPKCGTTVSIPATTTEPEIEQLQDAGGQDEWYYESSGQQVGPVSQVVVKQMAGAGQISGATLVWKEGMTGWTPAAQTILSQCFRITGPPLFPPRASPVPRSLPSVTPVQASSQAPSVPLNDDSIRCPRCGSSAVEWDKTKFGGGRAALGCLLVGPLGALLGLTGKKKVVFTCLKCGNTWKPGEQT